MLRFDQVVLQQGAFTLSADLEIPNGLTAIIGPSGGGKSTLLAAVAGFLTPTQGRVLWNDAAMSPDPGRRPVATLFQDNNLFPHLSVEQNVGLGLRGDMRLRAGDRDRIAAALDQVGLSGFQARKPGALSGGQQSRAALARVLLSDRAIVALDEPFAALGPAMRADMLALTADRLAGRCVLMVTHDPKDIGPVADLAVVVADGTASPPAPAQALLEAPTQALRSYLG